MAEEGSVEDEVEKGKIEGLGGEEEIEDRAERRDRVERLRRGCER